MKTVYVVLDKVSLFFARVSRAAVVILCVALVGSILASVFFRYVVGQALSWPEEIALILFAWLVLLAGSLGVREGFHVRLTLITEHFPAVVRVVLDRIITAAVGVFGIILTATGYDFVQRTAEHLTPTLRLPLDWLNYAALACGSLIFLHALANLFKPEEQ